MKNELVKKRGQREEEEVCGDGMKKKANESQLRRKNGRESERERCCIPERADINPYCIKNIISLFIY